MDPSQRGSSSDHHSDPGPDLNWADRASWKAQKIAWKAQRQAQRAAFKAQRAAWKAQWQGDHSAYREPIVARWGLLWVAFWLGFGLLMAFSPEFRDAFIGLAIQFSKLVVHVLHVLVGRAEA